MSSKSVNFIEAINSGKKFKGQADNKYWYKDISDFWFVWNECNEEELLNELNGQFELEEKSINITESQLDVLLEQYIHSDITPEYFKKELGF